MTKKEQIPEQPSLFVRTVTSGPAEPAPAESVVSDETKPHGPPAALALGTVQATTGNPAALSMKRAAPSAGEATPPNRKERRARKKKGEETAPSAPAAQEPAAAPLSQEALAEQIQKDLPKGEQLVQMIEEARLWGNRATMLSSASTKKSDGTPIVYEFAGVRDTENNVTIVLIAGWLRDGAPLGRTESRRSTDTFLPQCPVGKGTWVKDKIELLPPWEHIREHMNPVILDLETKMKRWDQARQALLLAHEKAMQALQPPEPIAPAALEEPAPYAVPAIAESAVAALFGSAPRVATDDVAGESIKAIPVPTETPAEAPTTPALVFPPGEEPKP